MTKEIMTAVTMTIVFKVVDRTLGLRVSEEEEIIGLDATEYGLSSAYAGFSLMDVTGGGMNVNENTELGESDYDAASEVQRAAAVKVTTPVDAETGIHKVVIIAKLSRYEKCIKYTWCNRNDCNTGYGMRYPERRRRKISWCRNGCNSASEDKS